MRVKETGDTLRRVLDSSPDMIVATDVPRPRHGVQSGRLPLTGLRSPEAAIGRELSELLGCGGAGGLPITRWRRSRSRSRVERADGRDPGRGQLVSAPV